MAVDQKIVDECLRLRVQVQIRSGPTKVKSYGLVLARCFRFPSTILDRAEDMIASIADESLINIHTQKDKQNVTGGNDMSSW
jgi:DNA mismatch repair ATPase MutS